MFPPDLPIVDAHHHLWDLRDNNHPWLGCEPEKDFFLGDYAALKRNYLPEDYRRDAGELPVVKTVHVEAEWRRCDQFGETVWLADQHARHGLPSAIVAHAWFHTENAAEVLAKQAGHPLVRGIRSKPVTAARPGLSVAGRPGTMSDPRWREGFARLAEHGLSWDLRVPYWHLCEAAELVWHYPDIPVVLNHTGFPWDRSASGLAAWRSAMRTIAEVPHVHLKVSEFGLADAAWDYEDNRRVVEAALDIFGIERCMFASNFPVAGLRVDYQSLVAGVYRMLSDLDRQAQRAFFHDNADRFYRLT
ncbi:MAG: amidohydrolase family protein [Pseudomonadota bacterium]